MSCIRALAVGVNTARFAPSIMTPTVRMGSRAREAGYQSIPCIAYFRAMAVGASPRRTDGLACPRSRVLVHPPWLNYRTRYGGSEPPPYGWALVHPLHGLLPSVGGGSEPPPYEEPLFYLQRKFETDSGTDTSR